MARKSDMMFIVYLLLAAIVGLVLFRAAFIWYPIKAWTTWHAIIEFIWLGVVWFMTSVPVQIWAGVPALLIVISTMVSGYLALRHIVRAVL